MFADDTIIHVTEENSEELVNKMNIMLKVVEEWLSVNTLKLNVNKTKFMIVRSTRKKLPAGITLSCCDESIIEYVEKIKYLGVIVDSHLRLEDHCDYMLKKIGKKNQFSE